MHYYQTIAIGVRQCEYFKCKLLSLKITLQLTHFLVNLNLRFLHYSYRATSTIITVYIMFLEDSCCFLHSFSHFRPMRFSVSYSCAAVDRCSVTAMDPYSQHDCATWIKRLECVVWSSAMLCDFVENFCVFVLLSMWVLELARTRRG